MFNLDHMLNGKGSRERLQNAIRQAQHEKLAREVKTAQAKNRSDSPLRAMIFAVINLVTG